MMRGLACDDGEGLCTTVPFAVLIEVPFVGEVFISLLEASDEEVPFAGGIEEPGSFR